MPFVRKSWAELIGQDQVKENLGIFIAAAADAARPWIMFCFMAAGLGKTTLAHVVRTENGWNIKVTSGPAIEEPGIWPPSSPILRARGCLVHDEIHRLGVPVEE